MTTVVATRTWYAPRHWPGLARTTATRGALEAILPVVLPPTIRAEMRNEGLA